MQTLTVKVIASASREAVEAHSRTSYTIHVTQPAKKGKANKEMLKVLAHYLGVPQSHLMVAKGESTNVKTILFFDEL